MKKAIPIIIFLLTCLRIYLTCNIPLYINPNMRYDDVLMIEQASSLNDGKYLGEYNSNTLTKGIIYPLFISICYKSGIPYNLGLTCLFIASLLYFINSIKKKYSKNKLYIIYLVLLFNPISFGFYSFQKLYRNALCPSLVLIFVATFFKLLDTKKWYYALLLGLVYFISFHTRQDSIWMLSGILLLIVYLLKNKRILETILIPIVIVFLNITISLINYNYYGIYTHNELEKSEFKNTFLTFMSIDNKDSEYQISKKAFEIAAKNSKTFNKIYDDLDKKEFYNSWTYINDERGKQINNGFLIWAYKSIFDELNLKNATEYEELYKKIRLELLDANLKTRFIINNPFIHPPKLSYIPKTLNSFIKANLHIISFKNIETKLPNTNGNISIIEETRRLTNSDIINNKCLDLECKRTYKDYKFSYILLNNITNIYKLLNPIIFILFLYNLIKKKINYKQFILIIMYLVLVLGVSYTDAYYIDCITDLYLVSAYVLLIVIEYLTIFKKNINL